MDTNQSLSSEEAHKTILDDGFCSVQDPRLGQRIAEMEANATPFASADGLSFCNDNVLKSEVSMLKISVGSPNLTSSANTSST